MRRKTFCNATGWRPTALLSVIASLMVVAACSESKPTTSAPAYSSENAGATQEQKEAARFLTQATFGPTLADIDAVAASSLEDWFIAEYSKAPSLHLENIFAEFENGTFLDDKDAPIMDVSMAPTISFWRAAIEGDDQLRQRMAFALSQILVISDRVDILRYAPHIRAAYMDVLTEGAFGNYRDLLEEVAYSPAMAFYLTYMKNQKADPSKHRIPDENFARELMQLFTIGLVALNPDGTEQLDDAGEAIELYDNDDITGLARVFTGLSFTGADFSAHFTEVPIASHTLPLEMFPAYHSDREKSFLDTTIPAGTDGVESIDLALDALFNHPNLPPFISRQLIQRFVTSSPTPAYVERVAAVFASGSFTLPDGTEIGTGARGDLWATLGAILFDDEARSAGSLKDPSFGKVREPLIRFTNWARAFDIENLDPGNEWIMIDTGKPYVLSQHAYRSPSVFNFFRPDFIAPGTASGDAGMTAPELQILNATSYVGYLNTMGSVIVGETERLNDEERFTPTYTHETTLADNPAALVSHLDLILTNGRMSDVTRSRILEAIKKTPIDLRESAEGKQVRVALAILMTMTSPDYIVQK